jgi:hypothetical protein
MNKNIISNINYELAISTSFATMFKRLIPEKNARIEKSSETAKLVRNFEAIIIIISEVLTVINA